MIASSGDELDDFRREVRRLLAGRATAEDVRKAFESEQGFDADLWRAAAEQLGVQGLLVPEALGGAGTGLGAAAVAVEELGGRAVPGPYLSTLLGGWALAAFGGGAFDDDLRGIADGRIAVAIDLPRTGPGERSLPAMGGEDSLSAELPFVADVPAADLLVVVAEGPEGPRLCLLDPADAGVTVEPLTTLDLTRRFGRVLLREAGLRSVALMPEDVELLADVAAILIGAEQVGIMRGVIERTVAYSLQREAFGRPIGSFQAVKHQLADLYCLLEQCDALLDDAVQQSSVPGSTRTLAVAALQCMAGPGAVRTATEGVRLIGGIGYTWEHDAHLYFRRARVTETLMGRPVDQRERLSRLLQLT